MDETLKSHRGETCFLPWELSVASEGYPGWKGVIWGVAFSGLLLSPICAQTPDTGQATVDTVTSAQEPSTPFLTDTALLDSLLRDTTALVPAAPSSPVVTSDTVAVFLLRRAEGLALTLNQINRQLEVPIDSTDLDLDLDRLDRELGMIETYFYRSEEKAIDFRTLTSIESILEEIKTRLESFESELLAYNRRLIDFESAVDRIERDSLNRLLPRDAELRQSYVSQLDDLTQRYREARELLRARLLELGLLQNRLTRLTIRANDLDATTQRQTAQYRSRTLQPNHPPLPALSRDYYAGTLETVLPLSLRMVGDTLHYFFRYNWGIRLINISLVLFFYFFARILLARIRRKHPEDAAAVLSPVAYFTYYPEISAVVAGLTIVPFLYGTPPLPFVQIIWVILFTLMSWLLTRRFSRLHFRLWLALLVLFVINGCVVLMITTTFVERWSLFVVNLLSVGLGIGLLTKGRISRNPANRYYLSRIVFWLFLTMNALALLGNFFGYYNFAVILSYAASFQVLYVMTLWVFIELMGELVFLYVEANKEELQSYSSWLDYQDLQQRLKRILGFVAVILWLAAFLKSLNVFDFLYGFADGILSMPRSIGSLTFTYGSLLVFVGIIYLSVLISRLLAYIFGNHGALTAGDARNNLGSTMLLVRIAVLAGGFLLALSAAGISLDKVAIILGALGVGIGFGLQNIVNNLVSGIILAFEKPIKIGDVIELGPFVGKVKEIGIRSSKVVTFDGADVIIPNGDLLSQQLTNWTLSNQTRRIELIVGVGYGSDIPAVREAIQRAINAQEKVLHYPTPLVLVNNFSDSSVDFRILFWTNHFGDWISIKSDTLAAIYEELKLAGIEIPFPKRDVFVHYPDEKRSPQAPGAEKEEDGPVEH